MSVLEVSRLVRTELEAQFAALFNDALVDACNRFEIGPLYYQINFLGDENQPSNFFRGDWSPDELTQLEEPVFPALAAWTGELQSYSEGLRTMTRLFSGTVTAHWRFFLQVPGRQAGLTNLREATESAMLATLGVEFSAITYRGDFSGGASQPRQWLDRDQNSIGFTQVVEYQASFEVNV